MLVFFFLYLDIFLYSNERDAIANAVRIFWSEWLAIDNRQKFDISELKRIIVYKLAIVQLVQYDWAKNNRFITSQKIRILYEPLKIPRWTKIDSCKGIFHLFSF